MHEVIDAALFQKRMTKGDDVVVVDIGDRTDSAHLHIAVDEAAATLLPGSKGMATSSVLADAVSTGMKL